ncbi:MAG: SRPBCC family protein, partial [Phycicoccus sp.]
MSAAPPPPVIRSAFVARPLEQAFAVFTRQIGAWWPLPTHGLFGADAGALAFEDGLLVERAVDGRSSVWGEVLAWEPPHRVVLAWHPGREAAEASEVEVRFTASDGGGTRVELEHRGWERFGESAMVRRHGYVGPGAWGHVLDHFADVADPQPDPVDTTDLAAAYEAFFAEAERGGFGPPPPGEWDAARVLAHVALNDLAMTAVAHALVHGRTDLTFGNTTCQDPQVLAGWVGATGDLPALVARGREVAAVASAAAARLDPEQLAAEVRCHLFHDGALVLDGPRPWGSIAVDAQASVHLPAHRGQLRDLR